MRGNEDPNDAAETKRLFKVKKAQPAGGDSSFAAGAAGGVQRGLRQLPHPARRADLLDAHAPKALDGYSILQISDIRSKQFGQDGAALDEVLKNTSYDVVGDDRRSRRVGQ